MRLFKRFIINGIILSATSIILRVLGVVFNAFVTRRIGADGVGLFTLIMSVYGLAVTVAASGVNLAATKMCAEAIEKNDSRLVSGALKRCLLYALICGSFACLLLYSFSGYIGEIWLGDARCTPSLKWLAVSLPFIAASNVLHGYFTASRKVSRSASVQIFEQLFKISLTIGWLTLILPEDIESACIALVGSGAIAETVSFSLAFILYLISRHKDRKPIKNSLNKTQGKRLTRELFGITIPVAIAAIMRSGLTTLEHILIPAGLKKNKLTAATAMASYGVLCGMAMPVIMFPTALLYSFTALLIPEFAKVKERGNNSQIRRMTKISLSLTLLFSMGCATIIGFFSNELGMLIYDNKEAGEFIKIMALLIPVMFFDHTVDAILKGLGEQVYCMKINILDSAMCALLVFLLCDKIGIWGYIITIYVSEAVNAALSLYKLTIISSARINIIKSFVKPILASAATYLILDTVKKAEIYSFPVLFLLMALGILIYFGILYLIGTFEEDEKNLLSCLSKKHLTSANSP